MAGANNRCEAWNSSVKFEDFKHANGCLTCRQANVVYNAVTRVQFSLPGNRSSNGEQVHGWTTDDADPLGVHVESFKEEDSRDEAAEVSVAKADRLGVLPDVR